MHWIEGRKLLLAPSKPGQYRSEILVNLVNHRSFLVDLGKYEGINDLVKVLLVEIVDGKRPYDRRIYAVGISDVIVECDGKENVSFSRGLCDLAQIIAIVSRDPGLTLGGGIHYQYEGYVAGLF